MSKVEVNSGFQKCLVPPSDWKLLQKWYDGDLAHQQWHPIWYIVLFKWLHVRWAKIKLKCLSSTQEKQPDY